jgi:hypothetical protein
LQVCFSQPLADDVLGHDYQHQGRIDVNLLRRQLPLKPSHFYICGPTPMLESLVPALEDWCVSTARIHFEAFGPASIRRKKSAQALLAATPTGVTNGTNSAIVATFTKSGKPLPWQPEAGKLLCVCTPKTGVTLKL